MDTSNESLEIHLSDYEIYLISRYCCMYNENYKLVYVNKTSFYEKITEELTENIYELIHREKKDHRNLILNSIEMHFGALCHHLINGKPTAEFYECIGRPINNIDPYKYLYTTLNMYILELTDHECKYIKGLRRDEVRKSKINSNNIHAVIYIMYNDYDNGNIVNEFRQVREFGHNDLLNDQIMRTINIVNKRLSKDGRRIKLKYVGGKRKFVVNKLE